LCNGNGVRAQIEKGEVLRPKKFLEVAEIVYGDAFDAIGKADVLRRQAGLLRE